MQTGAMAGARQAASRMSCVSSGIAADQQATLPEARTQSGQTHSFSCRVLMQESGQAASRQVLLQYGNSCQSCLVTMCAVQQLDTDTACMKTWAGCNAFSVAAAQ